jgi:hypothetical protein
MRTKLAGSFLVGIFGYLALSQGQVEERLAAFRVNESGNGDAHSVRVVSIKRDNEMQITSHKHRTSIVFAKEGGTVVADINFNESTGRFSSITWPNEEDANVRKYRTVEVEDGEEFSFELAKKNGVR